MTEKMIEAELHFNDFELEEMKKVCDEATPGERQLEEAQGTYEIVCKPVNGEFPRRFYMGATDPYKRACNFNAEADGKFHVRFGPDNVKKLICQALTTKQELLQAREAHIAKMEGFIEKMNVIELQVAEESKQKDERIKELERQLVQVERRW